MTVTIEPLDPADQAAMAAWYDVLTAVNDIPDLPKPSRYRHMRQFEYPWAGRRERVFVAEEGGRMVGFAAVAFPTKDNTHLAQGQMTVLPAHRRRGIGTALLDHLFDAARLEKRSLLELVSVTEHPGGPRRDLAGEGFIRQFCTEPALLETRPRLDVGTVADSSLEELAAQAWSHADGYTIHSWKGSAPDDAVAGLARLEARMNVDAPMGDLQVEAEAIDVDRIRADEHTRAGRGDRTYTTVARHDASGELTATTTLSFEEGVDHHAWQFITLVDPAHRGHRLGLMVKLANLSSARASEPALSEIDTFNAMANTHMLAVNERMGFRPIDRWQVWQVPVTAAA